MPLTDFPQYTTNYKRGADDIKTKVNYTGNNAKTLKVSIEESLKKLRTSYIDILYVHWWDWQTSIEEVMNNLHHLVVQGKVLYLVRQTLSCRVSRPVSHRRANREQATPRRGRSLSATSTPATTP